MPDFRLIGVNSPDILTFDWLQTPTGLIDETLELASAVIVAFNTDALADVSDVLPDPRSSDRRGWWGDFQADVVWKGWPIGCKLWLLHRAKILNADASEGSTVARAKAYIAQALQPFVDNRLCSSFSSVVTQVNLQRIDATIFIYRGPLQAIQLQFQPLWTNMSPSSIGL